MKWTNYLSGAEILSLPFTILNDLPQSAQTEGGTFVAFFIMDIIVISWKVLLQLGQ